MFNIETRLLCLMSVMSLDPMRGQCSCFKNPKRANECNARKTREASENLLKTFNHELWTIVICDANAVENVFIKINFITV